ncbi:hypothetical protein SIPHO059v1_p0001 [Vibrio phage 264E42.1]|nr:hypothetical protein SIPHO059v1_p0001 [Vibrio phage 264E42.1]
MTQPDRAADRLSLHKKSYEAKLILLETLGPKYGVKIYQSEEGKHPKDQLKTNMVRECPKHGKIKVRLATFVTRGNFACHLCAAEAQADATRKPAQVSTTVRMSSKAHTYIALSECGNYVKVGFTSQKPEKRVKQFDAKAPIKFNRYRYCTTVGNKAAILENFLKRALSKFAQTDLGSFIGGTEVFDLRKGNLSVSDIVTKLSGIADKRATDADGNTVRFTKEDLEFCEEKQVRCKRLEVDARVAKELPVLMERFEEDFKFLSHALKGPASYELVEVNKYSIKSSKVAITYDDKIFTLSIGRFIGNTGDAFEYYVVAKHFYPCKKSYTVTTLDGRVLDPFEENAKLDVKNGKPPGKE